jgi:hypothetical protein
MHNYRNCHGNVRLNHLFGAAYQHFVIPWVELLLGASSYFFAVEYPNACLN